MATIEIDKRTWNQNVNRWNELRNLLDHSKNTQELMLISPQSVKSPRYFQLKTSQLRRAIGVCQSSVEEQNERISVIEENRRNKIDKTKLRGSCGWREGRFSRKNSATRRSKLIKAGGLTMKKWNWREKKERKERGKGNLFLNFSLSALVSPTATDVVSFINRLDSATAERKTCSYAICHEDGASIKIDEAMTDSAKSKLLN